MQHPFLHTLIVFFKNLPHEKTRWCFQYNYYFAGKEKNPCKKKF